MGTRDYLANTDPVPTGNLARLFFDAVDAFADRVVHQSVVDEGTVRELTYGEVRNRVRTVVAGLRAVGLRRGDRVAILSENRPEWAQVDFGAICAGMPVVPVHTTLTPSQIAFLLKDSGARIIFASTPEMMDKALGAAASSEETVRVVVFDVSGQLPADVTSWEDFLRKGGGEDRAEGDWREDALAIDPHDTATILYTSGTTGPPKGVLLSHNNLYSNAMAAGMVIPVFEEDRTLSFLPLSHSLQRIVDYVFFARGATIAYGRSMKTIAEDLRIVGPTKVVGPPRFYEKSYQKVMEQKGLASLIVRWAREVGDAWANERLAGREPTWILKAVHKLAFLLVFRRIHRGLGGRVAFFMSGSAPLAPEINKFFYAAGVLILEGYGLSETSPVISVAGPDDFRLATVGPPIPGTEVRIAHDGEILVRGPQVMKGYLNRPEDTRAAFDDDGWLRTGDIGEVTKDGYLRITDRKKNLLVTAGGKNVAPAPIESRVKGNRFVDQVVMIGDGRHFPALLVVPSFDCLEDWAKGKGVSTASRPQLLRHDLVRGHMEREVFGSLGELASYERPKKVGLIPEEFTIEGGILTPNQKVKRRVVQERYGALIETLYDPMNRDRSVFVDGE